MDFFPTAEGGGGGWMEQVYLSTFVYIINQCFLLCYITFLIMKYLQRFDGIMPLILIIIIF